MEDRVALVTGAAGFIGSHLCDRLLADGWTVHGLDSFEDYYPREYKERNIAAALSNNRFSLLEANLLDLDNPESEVRQLVRKSDTVFHLAAQAGVRASWGSSFSIYTNNNILGTQLLLEACKGEGTSKVIYASTSSVYGDTDVLPMLETARCQPYSPYGVSKLAGENLCYLYWRNFGLPTVALRFFTVYGPRQRPDMGFHRFIRCLLENRPIPVYGDGSQTRDFTYVSDIVEGFVSAVDAAGGEVFNLGGGSRAVLGDVLRLLGDIMDVPALTKREAVQAGDVKDTWASLEHAHALLGYEPRVSLEDGLRQEAAWLRSLSREPGYPWGAEL
jgi:nucleoside-diphosphate-sugar epimerase